MKNDNLQKKQIIFDIDSKVAYEILGESSKNVWSNIRKFLENNGFAHIKYSGYQSIEPMSIARVSMIVSQLLDKYPYLTKCFEEMHVTNVPEITSFNHMFEYDGTPGIYKKASPKEKEQSDNKEDLQKNKSHRIHK